MSDSEMPPFEALLDTYDDAVLMRMASDKIDVTIPRARSVLVEAIIAALRDQAFVSATLATLPPPADAILTRMLDSPDGQRPVAGFRDEVEELATQYTAAAAEPAKVLIGSKRYDLYLPVLATAYDDDDLLNKKEARLLEALRRALGLHIREHYLLSYHTSVRTSWDPGEGTSAYERARDALLKVGLVQTWDDMYGVDPQTAALIRRAMDLELVPSAFRRLLERFTVTQLRTALDTIGLPLSGAKEERIERLLDARVGPTLTLGCLHSDDIKGLCRDAGLQVSSPKAELIASIVAHFDAGDDLPEEVEPEVEPEPEERLLGNEQFGTLLAGLRTDHLHAILAVAGARRSGTKAERVERIVNTIWSEHTLLDHLPKTDLVAMFRRLEIRVSGTKDEVITRLVQHHAASADADFDADADADAPLPVSNETILL